MSASRKAGDAVGDRWRERFSADQRRCEKLYDQLEQETWTEHGTPKRGTPVVPKPDPPRSLIPQSRGGQAAALTGLISALAALAWALAEKLSQ